VGKVNLGTIPTPAIPRIQHVGVVRRRLIRPDRRAGLPARQLAVTVPFTRLAIVIVVS